MLAAILYSAILNLAILDSAILVFFSQTHSHLPRLVPNICTKTSLIHSDSTWWLQLSWNLPSLIQPFCTKKLDSFILTHLDDGSHLVFCHLGFSHLHKKNFTHAFSQKLMMAAILNLAMLDSDTLFSSLRITQKHSLSTLNLIQTNSIWLT